MELREGLNAQLTRVPVVIVHTLSSPFEAASNNSMMLCDSSFAKKLKMLALMICMRSSSRSWPVLSRAEADEGGRRGSNHSDYTDHTS